MADKKITTYNSHNSPTTNDKFFMVGSSEEYLIDYDALASAILDKLTTKTYSGLNNSTVISALQATSYSTVLSASTYNDKAAALAALDSYANTFGGSVRVVGYISTANSNLLGLINTSHYFDFYVNSASYRLLVARPVNGNTIYQLAKQGGTWGSSWQQLANQAGVDTNSAAITDINNRFLKLVSGTNITVSNIDTLTTSGLYLGYIECTSITGSGGSSYGLLIVTDPPTSTDRIGQCIIMMQTGYIATRYNMNGTWSAWIPSDRLLKGRQYSSVETMYATLIAELDGNEQTYFSASSNLVASLTNSEITNACRVIVTKADNTTLDYMLFSPGANAVFIGRIGENGAVRNVTRFAKASDVATNTANIATNTSAISTLNTSLTTLAGKVVKTTLSTTQTSANATAETYNYQTISGLSDYAVVLVNVNCANLRQTLTFVNGDTDPQYLYEINGNNKIRGGYSVDWTNNRVRVRYLSAAGAYTYQNVYFSKVVGFIKQ